MTQLNAANAANVSLLVQAFSRLPRTEAGAPRLGVRTARELTECIRGLCENATSLAQLEGAEFLTHVLGCTEGPESGMHHVDAQACLAAARTRLSPPPEPTFVAWKLEYKPGFGGTWQLISTYDSYGRAYRARGERIKSCPWGQYQILGVTKS